jgi:CRISPR/Cas system-associated protein Cas10 (large subunit of type III CRISPR-Cas system)
MISIKMDLLKKKLEDRANKKQEVMHIHDSRMTCEVCGNTRHSENNCPETQEDVNLCSNPSHLFGTGARNEPLDDSLLDFFGANPLHLFRPGRRVAKHAPRCFLVT